MSLKLPRHRVLGKIAAGGMGSVLLGVTIDGSRPVALKHLHAHLAADAQMVAMFVDEARLASRLSHPNVVRVTDVEMIDGDVVLVMDFVEGIPLSALLRALAERQAPMPLGVATRILHDALLGLHAAHELRDDRGQPLGVVHRDVSPHNVLLGVDGVARITDFGVAKAHGRLAKTETGGGVKGKLQYLAPEQVHRRPLDRRVDVFSAGIVLWECLTGAELFDGESEAETLLRVIDEPIAPPSARRFEVPIELDEACLRALERDPARRWSTAEELARALEACPLADREEVARLVTDAGAEVIAAHRALLALARSEAVPAPAPASVANEIARPSGSRRSIVGVAVALGLGALVGGGLTSRYGAMGAAASGGAPSALASGAAVASTPALVSSSEPASAPEPVATAASDAPPAPEPATDATAAPSASGLVDAATPIATARRARPIRRPFGKPKPSGSATVRRFEPDDL